jgi:hypothetical protein
MKGEVFLWTSPFIDQLLLPNLINFPQAVSDLNNQFSGYAVNPPLTVLDWRLQRNSWDLLRCSQLMRPGEKPEALLYSPTKLSVDTCRAAGD